MPTFTMECTSTIHFKVTHEADTEEEAMELALMDAEDGQIGSFHGRHCSEGSVDSVKQIAD